VVKPYGNWALAMHELYYREPHADFYAIFQDDFITYPNLREYLEQSEMPKDGYLNLYTFPENQKLVPDSGSRIGWYPSNQQGKGAVALIFPRLIMLKLISDRMWIERPLNRDRGHKGIDGGIVHSLSTQYYGKDKEYCHNPSLVQHTGLTSSIGTHKWPLSESFRGEEFDALTLVKPKPIIAPEPPVTSIVETLEAPLTHAIEKTRIMGNHEFTTPWAVGDAVSQALDMVGITKERVSAWIGRPCQGCWERQRRLNQLGWLAKKALSGGLDEVKARFEEILNN
jgi:hypothetical protein